jgi:RNA-directed DNA polymerase
MKALVTELENEDEVRELIHLFPIGDVGVPQGSALSALCANIALSQFDKKMNGRGVTTIRYLDDFIVLGKGKKSTEAAFRAGEILLKSLGFECHDPFDAKSKKAASGAVITGMQFLSFDIAPHRIAPSKDALNEFLSDVVGAIVDGRKAVSESENSLRRAQPRYTQTLSLLDRKIRGWGDAFGATTDRLVFAQLDEKVDIKLRAFRQWFAKRIAQLDDRQKRRLVGIALLADTPIKIS